MDYKYIEQLLEKYWSCETTLEEEGILKAFFAQKDIPTRLLPYQSLFVFEQQELEKNVLDTRFDDKVLALIEDEKPVKAKVVTMRHRLAPLFKAAAVVAMVLTLGNAIQDAFYSNKPTEQATNTANIKKIKEGAAMAKTDSIKADSIQHKIDNGTSTMTR